MSDYDELAEALNGLMRQHSFQVTTALTAHADWKRRLRDAVVRGWYDLGSEEASRDDACALGRWLHTVEPETRGDGRYAEIVELHACFHREAGEVVALLEAGRIDAAREAMAPESPFGRASEELVDLLEAWRAAA